MPAEKLNLEKSWTLGIGIDIGIGVGVFSSDKPAWSLTEIGTASDPDPDAFAQIKDSGFNERFAQHRGAPESSLQRRPCATTTLHAFHS